MRPAIALASKTYSALPARGGGRVVRQFIGRRRDLLGLGTELASTLGTRTTKPSRRTTKADVPIDLLLAAPASATIDSRFQAGSESAYDMPLAGAGQRAHRSSKARCRERSGGIDPGMRFVELRRWPGVWGVKKDQLAPAVFNRWLRWSLIRQARTAAGRFSVLGPSEGADGRALRRPFGPATCSSISRARCWAPRESASLTNWHGLPTATNSGGSMYAEANSRCSLRLPTDWRPS